MADGLELAAIEPLLRRALAEDLGQVGDITSNAVVPAEAPARAVVRARRAGTIAGIAAAARVFSLVDPELRTSEQVVDGSAVTAGESLLTVSGSARSLLAAERTALNCISHLSGIATETRRMVDLVAGTRARVCCTRKTNLGMRLLEKYAVRMGGGANHRAGLYDAMLIKDNHIMVAGSIRAAVAAALLVRQPGTRLEVEVDSVDQLRLILDLPIDAVLLDNMTPDALKVCVALVAGKCVTEASGGVTADTICSIAETGVDVISVGWLTHSAPALDIGLDVEF